VEAGYIHLATLISHNFKCLSLPPTTDDIHLDPTGPILWLQGASC